MKDSTLEYCVKETVKKYEKILNMVKSMNENAGDVYYSLHNSCPFCDYYTCKTTTSRSESCPCIENKICGGEYSLWDLISRAVGVYSNILNSLSLRGHVKEKYHEYIELIIEEMIYKLKEMVK
nr:MAG: hypothetical protein [Lokiarchaeota virus Ratatoskr Meg22_1012]